MGKTTGSGISKAEDLFSTFRRLQTFDEVL